MRRLRVGSGREKARAGTPGSVSAGESGGVTESGSGAINIVSAGRVRTAGTRDNGIEIHPKKPDKRCLSSTSRFPYPYWIGADITGETANAARARTT
jgi:hypothetical protein